MLTFKNIKKIDFKKTILKGLANYVSMFYKNGNTNKK